MLQLTCLLGFQIFWAGRVHYNQFVNHHGFIYSFLLMVKLETHVHAEILALQQIKYILANIKYFEVVAWQHVFSSLFLHFFTKL